MNRSKFATYCCKSMSEIPCIKTRIKMIFVNHFFRKIFPEHYDSCPCAAEPFTVKNAMRVRIKNMILSRIYNKTRLGKMSQYIIHYFVYV